MNALKSMTWESLAEAEAVRQLPLLDRCVLCGRRCGIDRRTGAQGPCRGGLFPRVAAWVRHGGEEPPLCGQNGSGAIFFAGCSLRCVFCQNYRISQHLFGVEVSCERLSTIMLELQQKGVANINLVSPTHYVPQIRWSITRARERGLTLPIVYNSHGYDSPEALDLLNGLVDIYLPDMKYSSDENARRFSGVTEYCVVNRNAVERMFDHVGHLALDPRTGLAIRGVLVRLLVLPGGLAGIEKTLAFLKGRFGRGVALSVMAQYHPLHHAHYYPPLDRTLASAEYEAAVKCAEAHEFDELWIQDLESSTVGIPDFSSDTPFVFDQGLDSP